MTMVTREMARELAENELRQLYGESAETLAIDDRATREEAFGWVFFYETKKYLDDGDPDGRLVGNAPIVVDRDGTVHETGTAEPIDHYLELIRSQLGS
jgi:Immunity protein 35